jgi:DNA-binding MarR family transcriptional regulator
VKPGPPHDIEADAPAKAALAACVWQLMFDYLIATSPSRAAALARRQLTANDARGLWSLSESEGRPVGSLAREWSCDPSNATFIVDRLVRAGLASRHESAADRRIKLVSLTKKGESTRQELLREYHAPPPGVLKLSVEDLEQLERLLRRL